MVAVEQLRFVKGKDIVGKTVAGMSARFASVVISFSDGTWTTLQAEGMAYDDCTILFRPTSSRLLLLRAGVISREQFQREEEERAALRDEIERAEYDRLKAKFEPKQG